MFLKDLIKELQDAYDKEVVGDYLEVFGEPEIMIDTFDEDPKGIGSTFVYKGFDKKITIDRSADGTYMILNRFKQ
jgi:hypothetical protein